MKELSPGNEPVKAYCPECGKQYTAQARHLEANTLMIFIPHYGRAYALMCQPCQDAIVPHLEAPQVPPTRQALLRAELVKGFAAMQSGANDQASARFLFVIAQALLDLAEGEQPPELPPG